MKISSINLSKINKAVTGVTETVRKSKLLIDDISEKDDIIDDFPPDPSFPRPFPDEEIKKLPKSPTPVPIDYHAKITEVLDYNRVRVDTSYEDGADDAGHSGEDNSRKRFS